MSVFQKNSINNLLRSSLQVFSFFFFLIFALKWPFFSVSPVWDEAFSIFPAADFLVTHGFDYSLLLSQPNYHDGGPIAHALSLLTLVTAIVLKITGGGMWAWVILHVLQWVMAAAIGTMLTRIYSNLFDVIPAFLLAIATLVYPLMLAQLGGMYLEVPLLFFSILAFYHYQSGRIWLVSLFLIGACMTKGSGVIAIGTLALLALCDQKKPFWKRFVDSLILVLPAIAIVLALSVITTNGLSFSNTYENILKILFYRNLTVYQMYVSFIPELIFIVASALMISILFLFRRIYQQIKTGLDESDVVIYNYLFIINFSVFHFIVYAYMQTSDSHFLSRYFFYVIPSMFFIIYYPIDRILIKNNIKIILLLIAVGVCLINRSGMFYPPIPFSSIAIAERSEEYIDGYKVQKDYIGMIEKDVPENIPVFVNLPDYFLTHYSVSDYVRKPLPNVHFIGHVIYSAGKNFSFPDHFVLVYHYPWLGGQYIKKIVHELSGNKEFSVKVLGSYKRGYFEAFVFEINKK
jgi:hypothetical protein